MTPSNLCTTIPTGIANKEKNCTLRSFFDCEILNKLNAQETKVVTGFNQQMPHLGPRLQKINPETLQLVKVYESVTEAMNEDKNIKRPSVMNSAEQNTIYNGFRWQLVEQIGRAHV